MGVDEGERGRFSDLLLTLYHSAREIPLDEFQEQPLTLLKALLPFDAARRGGGIRDAQGGRVPRAISL